MKFVLLFLFCVFHIACTSVSTSKESIVADKPDVTSNDVSAWIAMTGKWFGSQPMEGGGSYDWVVTRNLDGLYKLESRQNGGEKYTEIGEWGIVGPIYFINVKGWMETEQFVPSDPTDPYMRSAYEVLELTEELFKYRAFSDGSVFTMKKVSADFQF